MFTSDTAIYKTRIDNFLKALKDELYGDYIPLDAEYALSKKPVLFADKDSLTYKPVKEGEVWGKNWDNAWFRLKAVVPERFAGSNLCLEVHLGGEALIFDRSGCPVFSFSAGSIFDLWYTRTRFELPDIAVAGAELSFDLEATAQGMYGLRYTIGKEHPYGFQQALVNRLRLCRFDRQRWQFLLDMEACVSLYDFIADGDYRKMQILNAVNEAVSIYETNGHSGHEAAVPLRKILDRKAYDSAMTAYSIGHAHIDVGWLWPIRESTRKAARTFSTQLLMMEKYPDYIFGASQAYLYDQVKQFYPALYEKIKARIKEGRWEVQGGMWVESDCNVVNGESLIRQFLYGKNFFRDEFGIDVKTLWLPDVFGYPACLPQIICKAGCDTFMTTKLSWNMCNKIPYATFRWKGVDGTEVLTHFPPSGGYSNNNTPAELADSQNKMSESPVSDTFLNLFGIGDGGGGSAEEQIEGGLRMRNLECCPKVKFATSADFFDTIRPLRDRFPEWRGELYFERHRGTYSTQARTKRGNRKCEEALLALETLAQLSPAVYPRKNLDEYWKLLLLNQFHDVIPGSSINEIYQQTEQDYAWILKSSADDLRQTAGQLFRKEAGSMVLCNTLSETFDGVVTLPENWNSGAVDAESGRPLPCQTEGGVTLMKVSMDGLSFRNIRKGGSAEKTVPSDSFTLENNEVAYRFSPKGELLSAFDKTAGREVLRAPGNHLSVYLDTPNLEDAWDIEPYYPEQRIPDPLCVEAHAAVSGPVRSTLSFSYTCGTGSSIRQTVSLGTTGKRLDFETHVEWHEEHKMLRVAFPLDIHTEQASYDIQDAVITRPMNTNTSWEQAKFEAVGQRFADISDSAFGAALLNDCKYGYGTRESTLDLCLLRASKHPDFFADQGSHTFIYSFLPHMGCLAQSDVLTQAAALNRAPLMFNDAANVDAQFPFRLEADGISVKALKIAEHGSAKIVRLVETLGARSCGTLVFNGVPPNAVAETDLMEWNSIRELPLNGNALHIALKPFEILTLKLDY